MKVLQFIASKGWGGAEKSFVELCNGLSKDLQVEVILLKENEIAERLDPKIIIHKLHTGTSRHNPLLYLELAMLVKKVRPDIIHTHSAKASEIVHMLSKIISCKQVATKRNPRKGKIFNKIKHVTAISKDVARSILKQDVEIIYNGLFKEALQASKTTHEQFRLLAVGRLDKIKGFDILIEEVAKLHFPFRLDIVGEGPQREDLEKLIDALNVADSVRLLGHREDIPSLISQTDAVIISSHSEGFGRVLVETLFYGNLVLSTKVGLSIEILPPELLIEDFEIADKVEEVFKNRERYETLFSEVKEKWTEVFVLESSVEKYKAFYESVMK